MMNLIFKELRQLLPFAGLWLCLVALFYGSELATLRVDESSYLSWCGEYCDVGTNIDIALFTILLYLIAAYSLFPREFDNYTVDFLRSLPLSRAQMFFSKVIAAWLMLCLLLLLDRLMQIAVLSLNTQTITGRRYWHTDSLFFLRDCLFALVIVSHGVFLSWFRTIGLIIYCVYLIVLIWLEQMLGVSGIYNIFSFFNNEYDGPDLMIDWVTVVFHLLFAGVLLFISYLLWTKTDSKPRTPGRGKTAKVIFSVAFSLLAFVFVAGSMLGMMESTSQDAALMEIKRAKTDHYLFSYREADQTAMQKLQTFADDDYRSLVTLLDTKQRPFIRADMTSDSQHALGLASWKKIRMVLQSEEEVDPLYRRVLSHETAHVLQSVESNRTLAKAANSVGFFIEGMAQYTSFAIVPDAASRESNWIVSSVAWQRHNIKFDELANRHVFESLYDPELLYGIGDIWVEAMAQTCGQSSIGEFLRAVGRDDAPPGLAGAAYWRNHLQYIGCELEAVNNQWRKLMQQTLEAPKQGAFPYFGNVVVSRSTATDLITISAEITAEESGQLPQDYYVRIQSEASLANAISPVLNGKLIREGETMRVEFSVLPRLIDGKRFKYQLGYTPILDSRNYYDKWRSGSVPE